MYAIIRAGGKQHKVAKGDVIEVDALHPGEDELQFVPLMVVDDKGKARTGKSDLANARVTATVLGETKGPKVDVVKYRNKTGYRRHNGHRQRNTSVQISDIKLTAGRKKASEDTTEAADGS
ncbi:MAG: large subunit ribosomal protein [Actinomycetota bacterium]|nr:large subunit ribosomal protein [Actinomycetota bacterium]